jgi:hypothetical protein
MYAFKLIHHLLLFTEKPAIIETTKVCVILPVSSFTHSLFFCLIFAVSNATDGTEMLHNQA